MKVRTIYVFCFAFLLLLAGCQKENSPTNMEQQKEVTIMGYVLATRENALLVVNDKLIEKEVNGETVEHMDATWVITEEGVEIGTYVKMVVEKMSEDFPKTAVAVPDKMEIIIDIVENSNLTKAEVIQYTMKEVQKKYEAENMNINEDIPCVMTVEYREDEDNWAVFVRFASSPNGFMYIFDDK